MSGLGLFMRRRSMAMHPSVSDPLKAALIAAYTFEGRSNDDADRTIVKDKSGKGYDMELVSFNFSATDSDGIVAGYQEDGSLYKPSGVGYLRFAIPNLTEYTIIVHRKAYSITQYTALLGAELNGKSPIYMEYMEYQKYYYKSLAGNYVRTGLDVSQEVIWMNNSYYNNIPLTPIASPSDYLGGHINIGRMRSDSNATTKWKIYGVYLFDKSLESALIEEFIQKNIDESYVLP